MIINPDLTNPVEYDQKSSMVSSGAISSDLDQVNSNILASSLVEMINVYNVRNAEHSGDDDNSESSTVRNPLNHVDQYNYSRENTQSKQTLPSINRQPQKAQYK